MKLKFMQDFFASQDNPIGSVNISFKIITTKTIHLQIWHPLGLYMKPFRSKVMFNLI